MKKSKQKVYRITKADDRLVKYLVNYQGEKTHKFLKLKGKYVQPCIQEYSTGDGKLKIIDTGYIAEMPDGTYVIYNIEDETKNVNEKTLEKSYNYHIQLKYKYNLKINSVITTTLPESKCLKEHKISQTYTVIPIIISFTDPESYKELNRIIDKIKNNKTLTDDESLMLILTSRVYCGEYPNALEEICRVFKSIKVEDPSFKIDLTHMMRFIIHKFAETENEIKKLEEMIGMYEVMTAREYQERKMRNEERLTVLKRIVNNPEMVTPENLSKEFGFTEEQILNGKL